MYDNVTNPMYPRHMGEILNMDDLRRMIDGYDCGIRYVDSHIGQLLESFRKKGILDDMVIIMHNCNEAYLSIALNLANRWYIFNFQHMVFVAACTSIK